MTPTIRCAATKSDALGRSFLEFWEEARDTIALQLARAPAGESTRFEDARSSSCAVNEYRKLFSTTRSVPLRDEAGAVRGVLNVAAESTDLA